jgi:flagellar protein FliS
MEYKSASLTYKETRIKTANQGQLIMMLYDESIKQLNTAVELLHLNMHKKEPGRIEQIGKAVMKTEEIMTELMVSLDFEQGGEIAKNLFSIYTWFNRELMEANIYQDINRILTVKDMISDLRNTWAVITSQYNAEPAVREAVGLNIAG